MIIIVSCTDKALVTSITLYKNILSIKPIEEIPMLKKCEILQ